ncbi:MAG: transketolase family protein [Treponema sp.]|nr:transketolase family protein [Treponema sp.]
MKYQQGQIVEQRAAIGDALVEFGGDYPDLVVLDPDVAASSRSQAFGKKYPQRFYEVGIAEQNCVGIAAGLSSLGYIPFVSAFATFLTHRSGDQIRNSIAHTRANVKLNGAYGGLPTGGAGATHACFEDLALMRVLPNMVVFDPADAVEARLLVKLALDTEGPFYLRSVRCGVPVVFDESYRVEIGKAVWLREGRDISLISTGMMTPRVMGAADVLTKQGISVTHIHMPCIKPLDREAVIKASQTGLIITVENHSVIGGLGGAVAELCSAEFPSRIKRLGFQDLFLESGDDEVLFDSYGLSEQKIINAAQDALRNHRN